MSAILNDAYAAALQWHLDNGADEVLQDEQNDRTAAITQFLKSPSPEFDVGAPSTRNAPEIFMDAPVASTSDMMGTMAAKMEAARLAQSCHSLEELQAAISGFDGLAIRKTAMNLVFGDGNPQAHVMVIGEAPGADEDRQGRPFVGADGQLLDRILHCIGLSRRNEEADQSVYVTNLLNWRPPGNRTPTQAEIDISMPFIERHIALIKPKMLILSGGVCAKGLLNSDSTISKLRGTIHDYQPITESINANASVIPAVVTYHPGYLLRTPSQKGLVWSDMLMLRARLDAGF
jgi:uracil-DNA glycosylase family 4